MLTLMMDELNIFKVIIGAIYFLNIGLLVVNFWTLILLLIGKKVLIVVETIIIFFIMLLLL